jgi:hypothetical protein
MSKRFLQDVRKHNDEIRQRRALTHEQKYEQDLQTHTERRHRSDDEDKELMLGTNNRLRFDISDLLTDSEIRNIITTKRYLDEYALRKNYEQELEEFIRRLKVQNKRLTDRAHIQRNIDRIYTSRMEQRKYCKQRQRMTALAGLSPPTSSWCPNN